jgi:hypothetical protein
MVLLAVGDLPRVCLRTGVLHPPRPVLSSSHRGDAAQRQAALRTTPTRTAGQQDARRNRRGEWRCRCDGNWRCRCRLTGVRPACLAGVRTEWHVQRWLELQARKCSARYQMAYCTLPTWSCLLVPAVTVLSPRAELCTTRLQVTGCQVVIRKCYLVRLPL